MEKFDTSAPFFVMYESGRTTHIGSVQGTKAVNTAMVKLIFAINGMRLYTRGITPHRGFRLKDIKDFFGVKGNKDKVLEMLEHLQVTMENFEKLNS
jgi:hypothetical protein